MKNNITHGITTFLAYCAIFISVSILTFALPVAVVKTIGLIINNF